VGERFFIYQIKRAMAVEGETVIIDVKPLRASEIRAGSRQVNRPDILII